ncbi:hypothetical protein CAP40_17890 [Sphingomonas sp. IBVSS2]|uniref:hypothetical protein n=1 Tax=Sphingomonas sp. IBVSS2 TaxID=1985172 RepID=UPI000A2E1B53|nr:hypothetical protein [Sphingomonas sp. IBVSS2]OSZ63598.1 hypothetical protein CAP40_17890 [Sphingomonas sp. IBVSS2]
MQAMEVFVLLEVGEMTIENFKLAMPGQLFIFISARSAERSVAVEKALVGIGAKVVGPHALAVRQDKTTVDDIQNALGDFEEGECLYVIAAKDDLLETTLMVPPRLDGGIVVA